MQISGPGSNKELARILGYSSEDELLRFVDARLFFAEEEWNRISDFSTARVRGEIVPATYEVKGKRHNGTSVELDNRAFPVKWGDDIAVCAMLTEITDQKKLEAQLRQAQRLEAVGQLTGGLAHDFNNLLLVILGNAELLDERLSSDPDLRDFAQSIYKAARRGADLTSRLLSFARRQPLESKAINIAVLVGGMNDLLAGVLAKNIELKTLFDHELWSAEVDASQLENAILNLAINARDAMPDTGTLTIEVRNAELDGHFTFGKLGLSPGEYVSISVSDTGVGMTDQTIAQAFEPFFTTKEVGKGSGLGLSMVYGFVKQSQGHVSVYSEVGKGTAVKMFFPRSSRPAELAYSAGAAAHLPTGSEKILVVEDDDLVRHHVSSQLRGLGYNVVTASDGREAVEVLKNNTDFDLLFTDVVMPKGVTGQQLANTALALYPNLPVLFTSGFTENAIIHQGALDQEAILLSKPYKRADLAQKVRAAIDQKP